MYAFFEGKKQLLTPQAKQRRKKDQEAAKAEKSTTAKKEKKTLTSKELWKSSKQKDKKEKRTVLNAPAPETPIPVVADPAVPSSQETFKAITSQTGQMDSLMKLMMRVGMTHSSTEEQINILLLLPQSQIGIVNIIRQTRFTQDELTSLAAYLEEKGLRYNVSGTRSTIETSLRERAHALHLSLDPTRNTRPPRRAVSTPSGASPASQAQQEPEQPSDQPSQSEQQNPSTEHPSHSQQPTRSSTPVPPQDGEDQQSPESRNPIPPQGNENSQEDTRSSPPPRQRRRRSPADEGRTSQSETSSGRRSTTNSNGGPDDLDIPYPGANTDEIRDYREYRDIAVDHEDVTEISEADLTADRSPLDPTQLDAINAKILRYYDQSTREIDVNAIPKFTRQEAEQRERQFPTDYSDYLGNIPALITSLEGHRDMYRSGTSSAAGMTRSNRINSLKNTELKIQFFRRRQNLDWTNNDFFIVED